jgi:hypothetical protein
VSFAEPGAKTVGLLITDTYGLVDTDTATVNVANLAPLANAGGPYSGTTGVALILDGSGSSDPGGGVLSYAWDLDNDGQYDDGLGVTQPFTWTVSGVYTIGLRVQDGGLLADTDTTQVTINSTTSYVFIPIVMRMP